jgi:Dna[CI] antecedent, DciA
MQNPKSLSDLLAGAGKRLTALKTRSLDRSRVLDQVRAALPPRLAAAVVSAGIEQGKLTIGVVGAVWASRLRYLTESVRNQVSGLTGLAIVSVRVRVVPPPATLVDPVASRD